MPICSACAAARRSARRTSGRRRSNSAGNADHHVGRSGRDEVLADHLVQVDGRHAQQRTQPVLGLPQLDLQLRDLRCGLLPEEFYLVNVHGQRLGPPFGQLPSHQTKEYVLEFHVKSQPTDPLLQRADLHVIRGHVAQQGDQHVVVALDGGIQLGVRGRHRAAEPAPEVELPGEIEARVPLVEKWHRHGRDPPCPGSPPGAGSFQRHSAVAGKAPRRQSRVEPGPEAPGIPPHEGKGSADRRARSAYRASDH